jgi:peptidoglycan/LPS O-acetylase OafA/YrhL
VRGRGRGAGVILLYALFARLPERVNAPLAWVGQRSLGVYVTHYTIIVASIALGVRVPGALFALATAGSLAITLGLERVPVLERVLLGRWPQRMDAASTA